MSLNWIATDLDGTLFSRDWEDDDSIPGTWHSPSNESAEQERRPSSWVPLAVHKLYRALAEMATIVPVTARDYASYSRVDIPGLPLSQIAVLSNGALVLNGDGTVDEHWHEIFVERIRETVEEVVEFRKWIVSEGGIDLRSRIVFGAHEVPGFVVAKADGDWWKSKRGVRIMEGCSRFPALSVSLGNNELQALPRGVSKELAVRYLCEVYFEGEPPLLCLGDRTQDVPFMSLGKMIATPSLSSIHTAIPPSPPENL
jgi:hydroxymethylpyrimidine pyrophosphatase-like HAD family hydrolase